MCNKVHDFIITKTGLGAVVCASVKESPTHANTWYTRKYYFGTKGKIPHITLFSWTTLIIPVFLGLTMKFKVFQDAYKLQL